MGHRQHRLGPVLGTLHAWRDRGSVYVDGLRTSFQAALLAAGVAKGADFTGGGMAVALGVGIFLGLEAAKVGLGWFDYRLGIYAEHQRLIAEANPVTMRQVGALERLAPGEARG